MIIEFIEIVGGKSGEAIVVLLMETIESDHEKVIEEVQGNKITITTEKHIGLDCAEKLFAVCGDNASSNNTFCNYLYQ